MGIRPLFEQKNLTPLLTLNDLRGFGSIIDPNKSIKRNL